ncbi:hypothetical protein ACHAXN_003374 [Cyclotella atomus]
MWKNPYRVSETNNMITCKLNSSCRCRFFLAALLLQFVTSSITAFTPPQSVSRPSAAGGHSFQCCAMKERKADKRWINPSDASDMYNPDTPRSNILSKAYHLYIDYFDKLWAETDVTRRKKVEKQKAVDAVIQVRDLIEGTDYFDVGDDVKFRMANACDVLLDELDSPKKAEKKLKLKVMGEVDISKPVATFSRVNGPKKGEDGVESTELSAALAGDLPDTTTAVAIAGSQTPMKKEKKKGRSVLFGATMGLIVAGWVYSGNYIFTTLFTLMTALGQLEYYRMVMNKGIYPARRISVLGACATFVTALFAPDLHQICLPFFSTIAMIWFLTKRTGGTTISEIATTFTGMFYLGYVPSYWVRLRLIGAAREPTRLAPLIKPILDRISDTNLRNKIPKLLPKAIHFPVTTGANFIFWSWLCIAFSDVGGYFAGRRFGKTKLGELSSAMGKASPNKTVEGVIGGCVFSMVLASLGAWVQKWPFWFLTGPLHGVLLALLGLVGDLTASLLKRDAGLKDFGDLIPEHGGIIDRVDSYIFTAPYGYFVCAYFLPWLRTIAKAKAAAPLGI